MFEFIPQIAEYLAMVGQSDDQKLMSGADQYGSDFILNELVPKALKEKKQIVWVNDTASGRLQLLLYRFESL